MTICMTCITLCIYNWRRGGPVEVIIILHLLSVNCLCLSTTAAHCDFILVCVYVPVCASLCLTASKAWGSEVCWQDGDRERSVGGHTADEACCRTTSRYVIIASSLFFITIIVIIIMGASVRSQHQGSDVTSFGIQLPNKEKMTFSK